MALFIWRKVDSGTQGTLPPSSPHPRAKFTARLYGKNVSRVMMSCRAQISACVTRLGPARRVDSLETVYMRKSWLAPRVTLSLANRVTLPPSQVYSFSCKRWLAPVGSGGGCLIRSPSLFFLLHLKSQLNHPQTP